MPGHDAGVRSWCLLQDAVCRGNSSHAHALAPNLRTNSLVRRKLRRKVCAGYRRLRLAEPSAHDARRTALPCSPWVMASHPHGCQNHNARAARDAAMPWAAASRMRVEWWHYCNVGVHASWSAISNVTLCVPWSHDSSILASRSLVRGKKDISESVAFQMGRLRRRGWILRHHDEQSSISDRLGYTWLGTLASYYGSQSKGRQ